MDQETWELEVKYMIKVQLHKDEFGIWIQIERISDEEYYPYWFKQWKFIY